MKFAIKRMVAYNLSSLYCLLYYLNIKKITYLTNNEIQKNENKNNNKNIKKNNKK